ncbi:MAG TPA: NADH:flavin oxidoreductase [Candidatus Brocadiales bacterium]|nr:NADH:flavin oxidoreductase [Candidatus Brocadiales bacterium]
MSQLFKPITINGMEISNRFVRSATNESLVDSEGYVTDRLGDMYEELAKGGVGLIITGYAYVRPDGKSSLMQAAIYDDKFIPAYKKLTKRVHKYKTKIALQIAHGGRQTKPKICGCIPIAPSAITDSSSGITPKAMNENDIRNIIKCFGQAARRAKEAGFDGVQLHAAHGYLLSEFISPYTNRRTDKWGGSIENRTRILLEVLKECRKEVGRDYPILIKLNSMDGISDGLNIKESILIAIALDNHGIDAIEVSGGIAEAGAVTARTGIRSKKDEAYFSDNARRIKQCVSVPVICVGGIRSVEVMEGIIKNRKADMIALSRPLIREPDLVNKIREGTKTKADCISCNQCWNPEGIRCAHLPKT